MSNVFAGKHGFITPRDLFKWAGRGAVGYQELAENGYLLLGERLRTAEDRAVVQRALENQLKVQVICLLGIDCVMQVCCFGFAPPQGSLISPEEQSLSCMSSKYTVPAQECAK